MKYSQSTPTFSEIFGIPLPERFQDLKRLPSVEALHLLSQIALLMRGEMAMNAEDEGKILTLLRTPPPITERINAYLRSKRAIENRTSLFNRNTCLQFAKRLLVDGADVNSEQSDIPGFEFLGYYFAIEESVGREDDKAMVAPLKLEKGDPEYFQKYAWPMFLKSQWLTQEKSIIFEAIKLSHSFKYLSQWKTPNVDYTLAVANYVTAMGLPNLWTFLQRVLEVVVHVNNLEAGSLPIIPHTPDLRELLDAWARPIEDVGRVQPTKGFELLYTKPLLKIKQGYLIIDTKILSFGLHDFVLHHFTHHSAVLDVAPKLSYGSVKQHLSGAVVEQIQFQGILEYIFPQKHHRLKFPPTNDTPNPDATACRGSDHFFFEMKDAAMPHDVVEQRTFDLIRDDIQTKFIEDKSKNRPRGAAIQLSRYIRAASEKNPIVPDKTYPVVVYSDDMYGMPGISSLVSSEFNVLHNAHNGSTTRPLVMMSLTSLFLSAHAFRAQGMAHFIREHFQWLKRRRKSNNPDTYIRDLEINLPIEVTQLKQLRPSFAEDKGFLRHIFRDFLTTA